MAELPPEVKARFERLGELLEAERAAEKAQRLSELQDLPTATREALGRTVTRLTIDGVEEGVGYTRIVLSRPPRDEALTPFHAMSQGDLVRVTFPIECEPASADGTLERVDDYRVTVAVSGRLPDALPEGRCSIDQLGTDATYKRMRQALERAQRLGAGTPAARLRDCLVGTEAPVLTALPDIAFFDEGLNEWQKDAVRIALAADPLSLVHGPPGTGKTTVLAEVVRQAAAQGLRVLASAPSNVAVDNILEKVLVSGLRVVRLGHPARTLESLRHANLAHQVAADPQFEQVQEMDSWRDRLRKKMARKGTRPLSYGERDELRTESDRLWKEARKTEEAIGRRIVLSAQVVLSTHGGLASNQLKGDFDLAVLDEASQAPEPLSWIPLTRAGRAVFAGDARQLPPTLYSKDAQQSGLAVTLLERLEGELPKGHQTLLRVQYRMNEAIMGFSSREFYEGKLIAHDSVKDRRAEELDGVASDDLTSAQLVFVDTAGTGWEEGLDELLQSRYNDGEAELTVKLAQRLLDAGMAPRDIAILAPYSAQVRRLKALLRVPGLEIGTVDGFQGREKEATLLSLVRCNDKGEVGFLADTRRMNVAVTRARRLSIVVGDSVTIARHPFYKDFLAYVEEKGAYRSAYEF